MIELMPGEKLEFMPKDLDPGRKYLISNFGRCFSLKSNKWLIPHPNSNGYQRVDIAYFDGPKKRTYQKNVFLHLAVVKVFGDCYGNKFDTLAKTLDVVNVDHIDKNKKNNSFTNLQIVSFQENIKRRDMTDEERLKFLKTHFERIKQSVQEVDISDIF